MCRFFEPLIITSVGFHPDVLERKVGLYGLYECELYVIIPVPLTVFGRDPVMYTAMREVLHTTVFRCDGGTRSEFEVYFQRLQLCGICKVFAQIKHDGRVGRRHVLHGIIRGEEQSLFV